MRLAVIILFSACTYLFAQNPVYLYDSLYFADPSAHVFNDKIYIYPSHDINTGKSGQNGDHYDMKDYSVLSIDKFGQQAQNHGVALDIKNVKWAGRQMWAPDCASKNGKYYFYFPAKDKNDIFRIGVAVAKNPEGPFVPAAKPIKNSYSIDPAVFVDSNGEAFMYFGGLSGGQLQQYKNNIYSLENKLPADNENALCPKVAKMNKSMTAFVGKPKDLILLDEKGNPLKAGDGARRFFEGAWMHKYNGKYYFSYSTGTTHLICYAVGDSPYGPFTYKGVVLTPVTGWTTHHSIIEFQNKWYLFYHDSKNSGKNHLRSIKMRELKYNADGTIVTMNGAD